MKDKYICGKCQKVANKTYEKGFTVWTCTTCDYEIEREQTKPDNLKDYKKNKK